MACYSCIVVAGLILSSGIVVFGSKQDSLPRSAKHHTNTGISSTSSSSSTCGVYLAESTIPHAGLGMYAGKDFEEKEEITAGDIIIPLIEIDWNNGHEEFKFLWDDYVWSKADPVGMDHEEVEGEGVSAASTGIGAAINCRLSMDNVEGSTTKIDYAGLHRSTNPGAGAITPFHDRRGITTEHIRAGQELFIFYGETYFTSRRSTYGLVPLLDDFKVADGLLKNLTRIIPENTTSLQLRQDVLDLISKFPFEHGSLNAMPTNASRIEHAVKVGTGKQYDSTRDLEWLQEHGKCMDNIKPGPSTIPEAGRGAFATRFIPKGGVVAPAPLLHITNMTRMLMYETGEVVNGHIERNASAPVHEQLLLNYCFAANDSTLLLSSYGMVTGLINHSSKKPNVKIQWSDVMLEPEWRNLSLQELSEKEHAGLVFEYVALTDIQEGDEILLNYGKEWEDAWNEHVAEWKPPKHSEKYTPAFELEHDVDGIIRTVHEEPYSDNVYLYFYEEYRQLNGLKPSAIEHKDWLRPRVLDRYQDLNNETVYMVEIYHDTDDDEDKMTYVSYDKEVVFAAPRDAFQFLDAPYSRDHYLHTSFRHPMMIPDEIFPDSWRNLRAREEA